MQPLSTRFAAALEQTVSEEDTTFDMHDDVQHLVADVQQDVDMARRFSDVADNLEDAVAAMEGLESADPRHLMLLEAVLNMANAGTPARADGIIPSLESYLGSTVAMEGVNQSIRTLLVNVRRIIRELWHKLKDLAISIFNEVGRLRLRLQYTETLIDEIDGRSPKRESTALGTAVYGVCTEAGLPKDARQIVIALTDLLQQTKALRMHYVPKVMAIGQELLREIPKFPKNPEGNQQWLANLNKIASAYDVHTFATNIVKTFGSSNPAWPAGSAQVGTPLPGFRSLVFLDGAKIATDDSDTPMAHAARIQSSQVLLTRTRQVHNVDLTKAEMETISNDSLKEITALVAKLIDEVDQGLKSGLRSNLERMGRAVEDAAAKIDDSTDSDYRTLQRGLRYTTIFTSWVTDPYVQILGHTLYVCRSALSVVSRHTSSHH